MKICQTHQSEAKWIPAGISKKTGKSYEGFWGCKEMGCRGPIVDANEKTVTPVSQVPAEQPSSKDDHILWQVAFKGAAEIAKMGKGVDMVAATETMTQRFYDFLKQGPKKDPQQEMDSAVADDVPFA